jgi:hypothetical protein
LVKLVTHKKGDNTIITNAKDFLFLIKEVTNEDFDEEAAEVIGNIVKDWRTQILGSSHSIESKVDGAIYQGAFLGLQFAARARRILAKRLASDMKIDLEENE